MKYLSLNGLASYTTCLLESLKKTFVSKKGDTIDGSLVLITNTGVAPLSVRRLSPDKERTDIYQNDNGLILDVINDETTSGIYINFTATDTEGNADGSKASSNSVSLISNSSGTTMTATTFKGNLSGNATTATNATNSSKLGGYSLVVKGEHDTWDKIPMVTSDGVLEVGKYIDFHTTDGSTVDYDVRITASTDGLTLGKTTNGTFSGSFVVPNASTTNSYRATRTVNDVVSQTDLYISENGNPRLRFNLDGSTVNYLSLQEDSTVLGKPLAIGSGGTGATTAKDARSNLGIGCGSLYSGTLKSGSCSFVYGNHKAYVIIGKPSSESYGIVTLFVPASYITSKRTMQLADNLYYFLFDITGSGTTGTITIGTNNNNGFITNIYGIN